MSPLQYFAIFLFAINAASATIASITNLQQAPTDDLYPVDVKDLQLNVGTLEDTSYKEFITKLRNEVKGTKYSPKNPKDPNVPKVPILPSFVGGLPHVFDVLLRTGSHEVTVRFRRDNLYVVGYRMQTPPEKWMEFNVDNMGKHRVHPNSEFLKFGDKYGEMEAAMNPPGTPESKRVRITDLSFTQITFNDAVVKLSKSTDKMEQARSLIFMAQMISEAARFVDVSGFFERNLFDKKTIPQSMRDLQNDWGKFSRVVQCSDQFGEKYQFTEVIINGKPFKTVDKLRSIFGLILDQPDLTEGKCGIKKLADGDAGEAAVVLSADI